MLEILAKHFPAGSARSVTFSDLPPGLYVLKIHAYNRLGDVGTVKRGFVVTSDPRYCSLVLINRGVIVSESGTEATVEVRGYGQAEGYQCVLDGGQEFNCEYMYMCHVSILDHVPSKYPRSCIYMYHGSIYPRSGLAYEILPEWVYQPVTINDIDH